MKKLFGTAFALVIACAFLAFGITQEVPVGRVVGSVTMQENGRTISDALVTLTPVFEPDDGRPARRFTRTDDDGKFSLLNVPAGDYKLEASAREHHLDRKTVTVMEGQPTHLDVSMQPSERFLTLYASQRVYAPSEKPALEAHGFIQDDKLHIVVRKLSLDALAKRGGFETTLSALATPYQTESQVDPNSVSTVVSDVSVPVEDQDDEGAFIEPLPLPHLPEGFYWVKCSAGSQNGSAFINVSQIAMISKSDGKQALSYVVDILSGKPIVGAQLLSSKAGHLHASATTNTKGLVTINLPSGADAHVVAAQYGGSVALCSTVLTSDSEGGSSGDEESPGRGEGRIFTYTDRPLYRPGDLVRFKSIVRVLSGSEYRLPTAKTARVELRDSEQNLISILHLDISKHGTLHGEFRTSPEAKPGVYQIVVHGAGISDHYFVNLAAYHKPDVKVTTSIEKKHYVMGDTVKATVSCEYYFGGPVVGAKINGYVYRSPDWGSEFATSEDDDGDNPPYQPDFAYSQGGEYSVEVHGVTDAAGRATLEFPTTQKDVEDSGFSDYRYDLSYSVQDGSDRSAQGSATAKITRAGFDLSVSTDPLIADRNTTVNVKVKATNYDDGHSPVAGKSVNLEVGEERWTKHTMAFVLLQKLSVVTDQQGVATMKLPVGRAQSLTIKASSQDGQGRTVHTETYLYVEGSPIERGPENTKFKLTLNKKRFTMGDQATALIQTDKPGGVALLTVEAEHIISSQIVPLTSGSTSVHLALPKEASPNVYISVCYVRQKQFMQDSKQVILKRNDRQLAVQVKPDRPSAQPGETVSFEVHTADSSGHGVPAEVSVGVVDESVYALHADTTDIIAGLFPKRSDSVDTEYSFPEVYLDGGDKAGGSVPIRTHFEDTASWSPDVETDSQGNGKVTLQLPDNLTTWRATAVGVTDTSQGGMATADIRSSKPLMVRVQSPPFMVKTDKQSVSVAITNDTGKDENVHFRFDTVGVKVDGDPPAEVKLSAGETQAVPVSVLAQVSGPAVLTARVWTDDGAKDGVESRFAVEPHGRLMVDSQSGQIDGGAKFVVTRDDKADPAAGRLAITITPSVVAGMYQTLDGLVEFPYGCVEQTMSRFLPAVIVTHLMREQGISRPELEKRIPAITTDGFARLASMQHEDGGWGWWTYDESDAFMTAWVLEGLDRLKTLGVETPPTINVAKALNWAKDHLDHAAKEPIDEKLYLLDALARHGKFKEHADDGSVLKMCLGPYRTETYPYEDPLRRWALGALAAHDSGESHSIPTILDHLQHEVDHMSKEDDYIYFKDERLSLALLALVTLNPEDPRIPGLASQLTQRKGTDGWTSTRATTFAIEGLTAYIHASKDSTAPCDVTVKLNGEALKTVHYDPLAGNPLDLKIEVPIRDLRTGSNEVTIHREGPGKSFYASECRQYRDEEILAQVLDSGPISVDRHYFLLAPQALEDGSMKLMRSKKPVSEAKAGDLIQCVLTVHSNRNWQYIFIEDPIPSNCRVTERADANDEDKWSWWWSNLTIFDDRVGLFASYFPKGVSTLTYTLRAEDVGYSHALPVRISDMYDPHEASQSDETPFEVTQ